MVPEWHLSLQQPQEEQLLEQRQEQFPAGGTAGFQPDTVWNRCTSTSCRFSPWCSWKSHMYTTPDWTTCWMYVFTCFFGCRWIWLFLPSEMTLQTFKKDLHEEFSTFLKGKRLEESRLIVPNQEHLVYKWVRPRSPFNHRIEVRALSAEKTSTSPEENVVVL